MLKLKDLQVTTEKGSGRVDSFDGFTVSVELDSGDEAAFRYPEDFEDERIEASDAFAEDAVNTDIMLRRRLHVVRFKLGQFALYKDSGRPKGRDRAPYYGCKADEDRLVKKIRANEFRLLRHISAGDLNAAKRFQSVMDGPGTKTKLAAFLADGSKWLMDLVDEKVAQTDVGAEIDMWALGDLAFAYISEMTETKRIVDPDRIDGLTASKGKISIDTFLDMAPDADGSPFRMLAADPGSFDARLTEMREFLFDAARPDLLAMSGQKKGAFARAEEIIHDRLVISTDRADRAVLAGEIQAEFTRGLLQLSRTLG